MWFNKYHQGTFVFCNIQYIWTDYTDIQTNYWEKHSSNFVSAIRKIYFHLLFYLNHQTFLIELILRYEKITLLRLECRNRFKIALIISSHSWVVIDASLRGPIYLLNMLNTRSYLLQNTSNIFCKNTHLKYFFKNKNTIFRKNRHQITFFCGV